MTQTIAVLTTQQIADRMGELFRQFQWKQTQDELFSPEALSIEPEHAPGPHLVAGLENIHQKSEIFQSTIDEVHGGYIRGPIVAGNHISFAIGMDLSVKGQGRRLMEEIAVYEVKDGKIVKEEFFY